MGGSFIKHQKMPQGLFYLRYAWPVFNAAPQTQSLRLL
jgi:hypothetical protein